MYPHNNSPSTAPVPPPDASTCLVTVLTLVTPPPHCLADGVDIRGANEFGWYSILVRTGNFKGKGNSDKFPAKRVFDDVEKAVDWILGHEERRYQNLVKAIGQGGKVDIHDERLYEE